MMTDKIFGALLTIYILSTVSGQIPCPENFEYDGRFCYLENATFINQNCPYEEYTPFTKYVDYINIENKTVLLDVKLDNLTGLLRFEEHSRFYDFILIISRRKEIISNLNQNEPSILGETCVVYNASSYSNTISLGGCDQHERICLWENNSTFCEAFDRICAPFDVKPNCFCETNMTEGFFCREFCTNNTEIHFNCTGCDDKFLHYGEPDLKLTFSMEELYLEIGNASKLKKLDPNEPVACYVDTDPIIYSETFNSSSKFKFKFQGARENVLLYKIRFSKGYVPGKYYCKGFVYPDFRVVTSNEVIYKPRSIDYLFVVTLKTYFSVFLNPYEEALKMIPPMQELVFPVSFSENNRTIIHIMGKYRLTRASSDIDQKYLELYDLLKDVISGEMLNGEFCLATPKEEVNKTSPPYDFVRVGATAPSKTMCFSEESKPVTKTCAGDLTGGAFWGYPAGICSRMPPAVTERLLDLLNSNKSANQINKNLYEIVTSYENRLYPHDIYLIGKIIEKLYKLKQDYDIYTFAETISALVDYDGDLLEASQTSLNATDMILFGLDQALLDYGRRMDGNETQVQTKNINFLVADVGKRKTLNVAFHEGGRFDFSNSSSADTQFKINFPKDVIAHISRKKRPAERHILVTISFRNPSLFKGAELKDNFKLTGWIVDVLVDGFDSKFLRETLKIYIKPYRNYRAKHFCVFWNYGLNGLLSSIKGYWVFDGRATELEDFWLCEYWHMTHFSLLLDLPTNEAVDIISTVGSSISLLSIGAIFATAFLCKEWWQTQSAKLAVCSCIPFILQMVFLVVATTIDSYDQEPLCIFIGICLQYSVVSQFCWMFVIGVFQYRRFVVVFTHTSNRLLVVAYATGWLLPIVPVVLTVSFYFKSYIKDQFCYLTGDGIIYGVFVPIIVVTILNLILYVQIFIELCCKRSVDSNCKNGNYFKLCLRLGIILFFMMGLSWIFGLLNGFFQHLALSYLFCFCASILGFILFCYHVLLNKDARYAWNKLIGNLPQQKYHV